MERNPERKPRRAGADFLSQKKIEAILRAGKPGLYCDGRGLYLKLAPPHSTSWVLKYTVAGRRHAHGLGAYPLLGLAGARATALEKRRAIAAGQDPILATRVARLATGISTFREAAEKYVEAHAAGWKGSKSQQQWRQSLRDYVYPVIGELPVQAVDTDAVLRCIEPLWATKPETASRVRGRIEGILTAAKARGLRQGDNPAQWRGHLETMLAPRSKVAKVQHFKALDYREIGAFMSALHQREEMAARALEFLVLTCARSGEVIGERQNAVPPATWAEIDFAARVWAKPDYRTKAGRAHRVPLSDAALTLLKAVMPSLTVAPQAPLFPGVTDAQLRRALGREGLTVHGMRSTFRDWCAETTNYPREVAEIALGHQVGDDTERAYQRGDLFEKRRQLIDSWARFCTTAAANVVT